MSIERAGMPLEILLEVMSRSCPFPRQAGLFPTLQIPFEECGIAITIKRQKPL
jgi:hypothetical protein